MILFENFAGHFALNYSYGDFARPPISFIYARCLPNYRNDRLNAGANYVSRLTGRLPDYGFRIYLAEVVYHRQRGRAIFEA